MIRTSKHELLPLYGKVKSYYDKAYFEIEDHFEIEDYICNHHLYKTVFKLYSYDTLVVIIQKDYDEDCFIDNVETIILPQADQSATTRRHVKEFIAQRFGETWTTDQLRSAILQSTPITIGTKVRIIQKDSAPYNSYNKIGEVTHIDPTEPKYLVSFDKSNPDTPYESYFRREHLEVIE